MSRPLESFGTLDKVSELHTLTKTARTLEEVEEIVDIEALENAAENLMQHLSIDHLDMLHHKFITGTVRVNILNQNHFQTLKKADFQHPTITVP